MVIISKCLQMWSFCLWISLTTHNEISLWLQQMGNLEFWTQLIKGYKIHDIGEVSKHFSDHQMNMFLAFTPDCLQNLIIYEKNVILKTLSALSKGQVCWAFDTRAEGAFYLKRLRKGAIFIVITHWDSPNPFEGKLSRVKRPLSRQTIKELMAAWWIF